MIRSLDIVKKELLQIVDPVKRRAFFIAMLSAEMTAKGVMPPIVVGGEAVEFYTQGAYTSGDIDLKADFDSMKEILLLWGFTGAEANKRIWISKDLDIYIDWLGATLDEGIEAEARTNSITLDRGLKVRVLSFEDLIIDRLCAAKFWNDKDSEMWASAVLDVANRVRGLDIDYIRKRAQTENVTSELNMLFSSSEDN